MLPNIRELNFHHVYLVLTNYETPLLDIYCIIFAKSKTVDHSQGVYFLGLRESASSFVLIGQGDFIFYTSSMRNCPCFYFIGSFKYKYSYHGMTSKFTSRLKSMPHLDIKWYLTLNSRSSINYLRDFIYRVFRNKWEKHKGVIPCWK